MIQTPFHAHHTIPSKLTRGQAKVTRQQKLGYKKSKSTEQLDIHVTVKFKFRLTDFKWLALRAGLGILCMITDSTSLSQSF